LIEFKKQRIQKIDNTCGDLLVPSKCWEQFPEPLALGVKDACDGPDMVFVGAFLIGIWAGYSG
jgi:hypothetical protein